MADMEDGCEIQVGGLAVELGLYKKTPTFPPAHRGYPGVVCKKANNYFGVNPLTCKHASRVGGACSACGRIFW